MRTLGVDPTGTGAGGAVLRDGVGVLVVWAWSPVAAGWRLRASDSAEDVLPSLEAVGREVGRRSGPAALVVEGLFVPPRWGRRASGSDIIVLAEGCGRTIAGLVAELGEPVARPTWREWAGPLGLSGLAGDAATGALMGIARREGWLPRWTVREQSAVADAGGISLYQID
jgi:hypothetical protein